MEPEPGSVITSQFSANPTKLSLAASHQNIGQFDIRWVFIYLVYLCIIWEEKKAACLSRLKNKQDDEV